MTEQDRRCIACALLLPRWFRCGALCLLASVLAWSGAGAAQHSATLQRAFSPGAEQRHLVVLHVLTEVDGQRPLPIGSKQYVEPFQRVAEMELSWRATRRVLNVLSSGSAEIEESLDEYSLTPGQAASDAEGQEISAALKQALERWKQNRTLRYSESPAGQLTGLTLEAAPELGENSPPLVTLWLLRALRPTAALPARAVRFGERWQEPRAVEFQEWSTTSAAETGEWLEAAGVPPAVRLHVQQQITGNIAAGPDLQQAGDARARFFAESLSTLSLDDARLLSAERAASREITWELKNVPGLAEPQRFRAKLSVRIELHECGHDPCRVADRRPRLLRNH